AGDMVGGWWVLLEVVGSILAGVGLLRRMGPMLLGGLMTDMAAGVTGARRLMGAVGWGMGALLLIYPGVISDVLGAVLLLVARRGLAPGAHNHQGTAQDSPRASEQTLEGEFTRES
ncbi:MAG: FxsA family protein, partial [Magnetococcus sp. WYHC-3]